MMILYKGYWVTQHYIAAILKLSQYIVVKGCFLQQRCFYHSMLTLLKCSHAGSMQLSEVLPRSIRRLTSDWDVMLFRGGTDQHPEHVSGCEEADRCWNRYASAVCMAVLYVDLCWMVHSLTLHCLTCIASSVLNIHRCWTVDSSRLFVHNGDQVLVDRILSMRVCHLLLLLCRACHGPDSCGEFDCTWVARQV
jgi:hypothetical protein